MSRLEKHAWFNLGVFTVACMLAAIVHRFVDARVAVACFALCGLWGIGGFLFYPKGKWKEVLDERERAILRYSWMTGHGSFWGLFVAGIMITFGLNRGKILTIRADDLPLLVFGGMIAVTLVQSVAMLVLSRMRLKHAG